MLSSLFSNKQTTPDGKPNKPGPMNWVLIALWGVITVMLFKSCGTQQAQAPVQNPAQILTTLQQQNQNLQEASAAQTFNNYKSALRSEIDFQEQAVKVGKATPQSLKTLQDSQTSKEIEGAILVADAQLRGGEKTGAYNKYFLAYETLQNYELHNLNDPAWTSMEVTTKNAKGETRTWTGESLYNQVVTELSAQNKHTLVYGFLPGYQINDFLVRITGSVPSMSYWLEALFLAILVRGIVWPLTKKQYKFGRQMMQLSPRIKEIKAKHPKDMSAQQTEIMALYKEYGINPAAGCFPMAIQAPFFIAIYDCMLRYRFEFQKGTFLWINPHFAKLTHGWTAPNLGQQDNVLIIIYAATMLTSQFLMPVTDPSQIKQQRIMGAVISIAIPATMFLGFYVLPCAFVLYWTFTNIIATTQALMIYRQPAAPLEKIATTAGGVIPGRKPSFMTRLQTELEKRYDAKQGNTPSPSKDPREQGKSFWDRIQDDARKAMEEKNNPNEAANKPKRRDDQTSSSGNGKSARSGDSPSGKTDSASQPSQSPSNGNGSSDSSQGGKKPKRRT